MKTRLFTRKRALISSVAMLLVAMLALGTATFAWFTSNPNATASGLTLKATAAKGLVIQTQTHGQADGDFWGHKDYLKYDDDTKVSSTTPINLAATSFNTTGDFTSAFTVDAEADDNYKAKDDATVGAASSSDYYQETIKCKLTGGETDADTDTVAIKNVTLTNNNKKLSGCIRVAIQYTVDGSTSLIGVYAPAAKSNKYLTQTGTYSKAVSGDNASFAALSSISNQDAGKVETTGKNYFTVTVYLDGEDASCFTNNIELSELVKDLEINLALKSSLD